MKKVMRIVVFLIIVASFVGIIGACNGSATQQPSSADIKETTVKVVGVSYYLSSWEASVKQKEGLEELAKEYGITLSEQDAKGDAATQVQQLESFIAAGVDGIITCTIDGVALEGVAKKAADAGIPYISLFVPVENAAQNVVLDEYQNGQLSGGECAKWLSEKYPGQAIEIALLRVHEYQPGIQRAQGMRDAIAKGFPTGIIVADGNTLDLETSMKQAEAILQAYPNVKAFVCDSDDTGGIGAYEVLKTKLSPEEFENYGIFASDGMSQAIKYLKEGNMYKSSIDVHFSDTAKQALQTIIDIAAGKTVPKTANMSQELITIEIAKANY